MVNGSRASRSDEQSLSKENLSIKKTATGFPSPADDYEEIGIDLNKELIHHPTSTFFLRANGNSMATSGIHDGDLLVVDRSLDPKPGQIVIAVIDGHFTIKRLTHHMGVLHLETDNLSEKIINPYCNENLHIWGVAVYSIHCLRNGNQAN